MGGMEETMDALEWFRKETVKAGFDGLNLQAVIRGSWYSLTGPDDEPLGNQEQVIRQLGFDGVTHYQFVHFVDIDRDYPSIMEDVKNAWNSIDHQYSIPYYPHVSVGWDNNPRFSMFRPGVVKENTPENFEQALDEAKNFLDKHPDQAPLVIINSWNEWTETSYMQPCTLYGYGYLKAVKSVFGDN